MGGAPKNTGKKKKRATKDTKQKETPSVSQDTESIADTSPSTEIVEGLSGLEHAVGHRITKEKKRRFKECPKCYALTALKQRVCPECSFTFPIGKRPKNSIKTYSTEVEDWRELEVGQTVYILTDEFFHKEGEGTVSLSYSREFDIKKIEENGLVVYSPKMGWAFIDMVRNGLSEKTLLTRTIPKIFTP